MRATRMAQTGEGDCIYSPLILGELEPFQKPVIHCITYLRLGSSLDSLLTNIQDMAESTGFHPRLSLGIIARTI